MTQEEDDDTFSFTIKYACECPICGKKFVQINYLKKHMIIHNDARPYTCDLCPKSYKRGHELTLHRKKSHNEDTDFKHDVRWKKEKPKVTKMPRIRPCRRKVRFCSICNKRFDRIRELKQHMLKEHDGDVCNCEICGKPIKNKHYLKRHMEIHKDNYIATKNFKCHICNKAYYFKSTLTQHLKDHSGDKPVFVCYICGKALASSKSLEDHIIVHQGLKPLKCEVCGKGFAKNSSLRVHMRSHTGVKPYRCDLCGKSFTQHPLLVIHTRYHTGERPYTCDLCSSAFVSKNLLNVHKKSKHHVMT